jgi:hypothetical protein
MNVVSWALARLLKHHRAMRILVVSFLTVVGLTIGSGAATAQANDVLSVSVRIHDYADIPSACMASAQEHVKDLYAAIGVNTIWAETVHPGRSSEPARQYIPGELLINIVTPAMSRRMGVTEHTLGLAAVTLLSRGKIAYLLFDRIRHVASVSGGQAAEVLGLVIAHEIGHLLLPYGSHSPNGLMRPSWRPEDFMLDTRPQPTFTHAQADDIRELLRGWSNHALSRSQIAE